MSADNQPGTRGIGFQAETQPAATETDTKSARFRRALRTGLGMRPGQPPASRLDNSLDERDRTTYREKYHRPRWSRRACCGPGALRREPSVASCRCRRPRCASPTGPCTRSGPASKTRPTGAGGKPSAKKTSASAAHPDRDRAAFRISGPHRGVAQLGERRSPKPVVAGSSPVTPAHVKGPPNAGEHKATV